ncbi:ABC transporter permease subunit [Cytobacillus oceanisediminis]|uniref:ABC transporter permease subunit n=1 Tax=Niallia alba TaxID=2729105 RepID=A0A7Y0PM14_9BACI|nr:MULTISPECIES: ABC transporter permease subunit [Bacillaceae]EOR20763.1 putative ABC transporter, permease [Niallia nealsonii AAU1]MBZ9537205.1 ABC transporter permease subunit [Cytobacillus oceanisediminis]NMO75994.1 ABC transporter permease subunit [Niallia alba]
MKNFITLFQKEMLESKRNGKWIWLPVVIMILGISQPITTYYMPQIIEKAGNLPEGAKIEFPVPTGAEVLAATLSQYGTIGTLLFVLATMGVISQERQNNVLTLIMARPVTAFQYIASKWSSQVIIALTSLFSSYVLTWYYTNLLFSPVRWIDVLISFLIYSLWIIFILTFTIWLGTFLRNSGGIAGVSITLLAALSLLTGLATKYMKWSPATLRDQATSILIDQKNLDTFFLPVFSTIILSIILFALAVNTLKRFEHF